MIDFIIELYSYIVDDIRQMSVIELAFQIFKFTLLLMAIGVAIWLSWPLVPIIIGTFGLGVGTFFGLAYLLKRLTNNGH